MLAKLNKLKRLLNIDEGHIALVDLIEKNSSFKAKIKLPLIWKKENNAELDDILEPYENLMALSLVKLNSKKYLESLIESFFICLDSAGVDFLELYKLYI